MPLSPPGHALARFRGSLAALLPGRDLEQITLGVAVSGGPDSVALLMLAAAALPGRVRAATVDHRFRPESAAEAAAVAALCVRLGVPHDTLTLAWTPPAANRQALARDARYEALERWAVQQGLEFIATGHHLDDQAETLLLRLNRGAGVAGLAGVRERRPLRPEGPVELIRPVLGWPRAELAAIPAALGIAVVTDPANADPAHDRTQVRTFLDRSPDWPERARLAASAATLAAAEDALAWTAERLAEQRLVTIGDKLELDVAELPAELRRRLAVRAIATLTSGAAAPRGDTLGRALEQLGAGQVATLGGVVIRPAGEIWRFSPAPPRTR